MYSPIMWAEPNKLKHLKEKRALEYKEANKAEKHEVTSYTSKLSLFEIFYKPIEYLRTLKISLNI
jgi:hypothetical protein